MRSAAVAGVPASGVGPGDLKSNSGVFERAIDGVRWIDPVFYPDNVGGHRNLFRVCALEVLQASVLSG